MFEDLIYLCKCTCKVAVDDPHRFDPHINVSISRKK